jgi:hypothetical protein
MADRVGAAVSDELTDGVGPEAAPDSAPSRWGSATVAIIFGLLFAYLFFQAISTLVALPAQLAAFNFNVPWWLLILGVVIPPALYVAGYLVARRRPLFAQALIFAVALAAAHALSLSVYATYPLVIL